MYVKLGESGEIVQLNSCKERPYAFLCCYRVLLSALQMLIIYFFSGDSINSE